jgi:hypothetical protein
LFGLQTITTRVRSVTADAIAGRSWPWPGVFGMRTPAAPAPAEMIGYASNDRHE